MSRSKIQSQDILKEYKITLDLRYATTIKRHDMLKITIRKLYTFEAKFSIARPVVNITSIKIRVVIVRRFKFNNMKNHETKAKLGLTGN